jgi:hypothetical protein
LLVQGIVSENHGENNDYAIGDQAEHVEPVEFILFVSLRSAADDVHSLNEKEVDYDLH